MTSQNNKLEAIEACITNYDYIAIKQKIAEALESGMEAKNIIDGALLPGMSKVGRQFRDNEIYVADVILAAETMQVAFKTLKPFIQLNLPCANKKIILGTVRNDLHDLGKTIVNFLFQAAGFTVIDIGIDVPAEQFISVIEKEKPDILGLSCTLTNTLSDLKDTVTAIRATSYGRNLDILVGGLSVTPKMAKSMGVVYGLDGEHAIKQAFLLINK